ncbi:MAG: hypothetical protein RIQ47_1122 [Bacteroidota bacterium]|jgi:uncharacterized membrane protein
MAIVHRFSEAEHRIIHEAIGEAERTTSGEIRVFIEKECADNVLDRAAFLFNRLGMDKTDARNGVLIYLATHSRKFAIIGDKGIHQQVGDDFWCNIRTEMQHHFMLGDFITGLKNGIQLTGDALSKYFPCLPEDKNELSDEIIYGDPGDRY